MGDDAAVLRIIDENVIDVPQQDVLGVVDVVRGVGGIPLRCVGGGRTAQCLRGVLGTDLSLTVPRRRCIHCDDVVGWNGSSIATLRYVLAHQLGVVANRSLFVCSVVDFIHHLAADDETEVVDGRVAHE